MALQAVCARRRGLRTPAVLGSRMQAQGSVFRACSGDCPKVCRAHACGVAAELRKPNYPENASGQLGSSLCLGGGVGGV